MNPPGPVVVMGAGSIGCYVGGRLQAAGVPVHFVGRSRVLEALRTHGLRLTDLGGGDVTLPSASLSLLEAPPAGAAFTLLAVKSGSTAQAASRLAPGSLVLSLQNGVSNAVTAAAAAPGCTVLAGMVPFNVAELAPGHFHRGTSGRLAAQEHAALAPWRPVFARAGLPLELRGDMAAVLWGKLLLNLNNPVNALSGLPLRAQLLDRDYRLVTAALQAEALAALGRAGIRPARLTPVPPSRLPAVLRLPTWLFRLVAARSLRIDAKARSSMADDLALGRRTEVDALCGEVARLAQAGAGRAPLNERIAALIENDARPRSARELRAALGV